MPKLERRLGPVLLLCLATVATVLVINGLFHESGRGTIIALIDSLEQEILQIQQHELAQLAGLEPTTEGRETAAEGGVEKGGANHEDNESSDNNNDGNGNGTATTTSVVAEEEEEEEEASTIATFTAVSAWQLVFRRRAGQLAELDAFRQLFTELDLSLWSLVVLSLLGFLLTGVGMFLFRNGNPQQTAKKSSRQKSIIWKTILALVILLLLIQLFLMLFSLLPTSIHLPSTVDRLLTEYLLEVPEERRGPLASLVEEEFACKLKVEHPMLEQLGLQEQCLPKIKDRLLAPYIVLFLILILICPFLFALFTLLWASKLKDLDPVREARHRVELSQGERRPQSREEILARALAEPGSPPRRKGPMTEKIYY